MPKDNKRVVKKINKRLTETAPKPFRASDPNLLDIIEEESKENNKLSLRQMRFCQEYIRNNGNATKAAIFADYAPKSAATTAMRLLKREYITDYIHQLHDQAMARVGFTLDYKYELIKNCTDVLLKKIEKDPRDGTIKALLAVLAETNKMAGHYAPDQSINQSNVILAEAITEEIQKLQKPY